MSVIYKKQIFKTDIVRTRLKMNSIKVSSSKVLADYLRPLFPDMLVRERSILVGLNRSNNVVFIAEISTGGIAGTIVDPTLVMYHMITNLCSGGIICHNHPSGQLNASDADKAITKKLKQSFDLMGLLFMDHLIITEDNHFSFADQGIL